MSIELISIVSGQYSNSYASLEYSFSYFEGRFSPSTNEGWFAFSEEQMIARLIFACKILDRLSFIGVPTTQYYDDIEPQQALAWPRKDTISTELFKLKVNGRWIECDEIPQAIKDAQCELALSVFDISGNINIGDNISSFGSKIKSESLGNYSITYDSDNNFSLDSIPDICLQWLIPFLETGINLQRE